MFQKHTKKTYKKKVLKSAWRTKLDKHALGYKESSVRDKHDQVEKNQQN